MTPFALAPLLLASLVVAAPAPAQPGQRAADRTHPAIGDPPAVAFLTDLAAAVELATHEGRPLFVHFTADWCTACKDMMRRVYPQRAVAQRLARFIRVAVDVETPAGERLWTDLAISKLPTLAFLDPAGAERDGLRLTGLQEAPELIEALDHAIGELRAPAIPARERAALKQTVGTGLPGDPFRPAPAQEADGPAGAEPSDDAPPGGSSLWWLAVLALGAAGIPLVRRLAARSSRP